MREELIRIDVEQGRATVVVFKYIDEMLEKSLSKVDLQREVVLSFLKEELKEEQIEVKHLKNGAPYIVGSDIQISISHSKEYFAVYLSENTDVGVDVQYIKKDIEKGVNYFVNTDEQSNIDLTIENLHLIWSAKEAVYKLMKGEIEFYKDDMTVQSIGDGHLKIICNHSEIKCNSVVADEFILVYSLKK